MYKLIIWDLDGTIIDPSIGIIESIKYALNRLGIEEKNPDILRKFIGPPLHASFRDLIGLDVGTAEKAVGHYRHNFVENGAMYNDRPYDGIKDLILAISKKGVQQVIATSKPTEFAERIIQHNGMGGFFSKIVGSNLDGTKASKFVLVEEAASSFPEYSKSEIVVIGDRKYEVEAANELGFDSICVSYGYGTVEEIMDSGPTYIAGRISELGDILLGTDPD